MKRIPSIFFVCVLLFSSSCGKKAPFPYETFLGMNGNVESSEMTSYVALEQDGTFVPGEAGGTIVFRFDSLGRLLSEVGRGKDGFVFYSLEQRWEGDGMCYSREYNALKGTDIERTVTGRDKKGTRISEKSGSDPEMAVSEKWNGKVLRRTDAEGRPVLEVTYNPNGSLSSTTTFKDGKIETKALYEYDEAGRVVKYSLQSGDAEPEVSTFSYLSFDSEGNWLSRLLVYPDGSKYIALRKINYR